MTRTRSITDSSDEKVFRSRKSSFLSFETFRNSSQIRALELAEIEGQHEEMVSRLKIRMSSTMRVLVADEEDDDSSNMKSANYDEGGSGTATNRLQRIIQQQRQERKGWRSCALGIGVEFVWWFAGHPSRRNNQKFVIYHGSGFRRVLDLAVAFAALSTSALVPLDLGFDVSAQYSALRGIDEFNTTLFIVDLFASFFTTYSDMRKDCVISSHRAISARYLRTWFPIDLVAALPLDVLLGGSSESSSGGSNASFVAKVSGARTHTYEAMRAYATGKAHASASASRKAPTKA